MKLRHILWTIKKQIWNAINYNLNEMSLPMVRILRTNTEMSLPMVRILRTNTENHMLNIKQYLNLCIPNISNNFIDQYPANL